MRRAEARKVEGQTAQEPRVVSILRRIVWACILKDLVKENSSTHAHFSSFLRHIYICIYCVSATEHVHWPPNIPQLLSSAGIEPIGALFGQNVKWASLAALSFFQPMIRSQK